MPNIIDTVRPDFTGIKALADLFIKIKLNDSEFTSPNDCMAWFARLFPAVIPSYNENVMANNKYHNERGFELRIVLIVDMIMVLFFPIFDDFGTE